MFSVYYIIPDEREITSCKRAYLFDELLWLVPGNEPEPRFVIELFAFGSGTANPDIFVVFYNVQKN